MVSVWVMEWATGSGWAWGKGSASETVWDLATVTDSGSEKALERVSATVWELVSDSPPVSALEFL
jgi:hypothetical protein